MSKKEESRRGSLSSAMAGAVSVGANMMKEEFTELNHESASKALKASANFLMIRLPYGFEIEKITEGLSKTSVALTNPSTLTILLTRLKSPSACFTVASTQTAALRAA